MLGKFNAGFSWLEERYTALLKHVVQHWIWMAVAMAVLCAVIGVMLWRTPTGFVPEEDQGYFYIALTLPDGTSLQTTAAVAKRAEAIVGQLPGVAYVNTLGGYTYLEDSNQPNAATLVVALKPWDEREGPGLDVNSLMRRAQSSLHGIAVAEVTPLTPAAVPGLGGSGGFTFQLQDRSGHSMSYLTDQARLLADQAEKKISAHRHFRQRADAGTADRP